MNAPFVVFSLPRSRSTWASVFLSAPEARCGHDIGQTIDRPEDFTARLSGDLIGTCETGAEFAFPLIRTMLPDARFAVIRRPLPEVIQSFERFGLRGRELDEELARRKADLAAISARPGVLNIDFNDLGRPEACAKLYRHCLGREMPAGWCELLAPINIQVDLRRQLQLSLDRLPQIEALKAEVRERIAHG